MKIVKKLSLNKFAGNPLGKVSKEQHRRIIGGGNDAKKYIIGGK